MDVLQRIAGPKDRTCCLRSLHCQRFHPRTLSESYVWPIVPLSLVAELLKHANVSIHQIMPSPFCQKKCRWDALDVARLCIPMMFVFFLEYGANIREAHSATHNPESQHSLPRNPYSKSDSCMVKQNHPCMFGAMNDSNNVSYIICSCKESSKKKGQQSRSLWVVATKFSL